MHTTVEFESELFKPFLPEESQVNPEIYGAELSFWLSRKLAEQGVVTSYPEFEDWGWYLTFTNEEDEEFSLCCGNVSGSKSRWRCFLVSKSKGLFKRAKANPEHASRLLQSLKAVLAAETQIKDISWSSEQ